MTRSCVLPSAQIGINANILQSSAAVGMNNTNHNIITTNVNNNNNNKINSADNNDAVSQNELLMKMLL